MKFQDLCENYGMIRQEKRVFYPRNFNLSQEFTSALKRELANQSKSGIDPDEFARKLNKALQFHVSDFKKSKK